MASKPHLPGQNHSDTSRRADAGGAPFSSSLPPARLGALSAAAGGSQRSHGTPPRSARLTALSEASGSQRSDGDQEPATASQRWVERIDKTNHWFRHPVLRVLIATSVVFLNFLVFAEDPSAHSRSEAAIPVLGSNYSLLFTQWPTPYPGLIVLKLVVAGLATAAGGAFGRQIIHKRVLHKRYEMFSEDKGTWTIMAATTMLTLFVGVWLYNGIVHLSLSSDDELDAYVVSSGLSMSNVAFMRGAAVGTWLGDLVTAFMVLDMVLQDRRHYPSFMQCAKRAWVHGCGGWARIVIFWVGCGVATVIVVSTILTNSITWDGVARGMNFRTTELGRGVLAGLITVFDLVVVTQDWEFPEFRTDLDIKLPGVKSANVSFQLCRMCSRFHITGKWFNYGILFLVMALDLNMSKNMVLYRPQDYGQYTDPGGFVWTVTDPAVLRQASEGDALSILNYQARLAANQTGDFIMNARYVGWSPLVLSLTTIPFLCGLVMFGLALHASRYKKAHAARNHRRHRRATRQQSSRHRLATTVVPMQQLGSTHSVGPRDSASSGSASTHSPNSAVARPADAGSTPTLAPAPAPASAPAPAPAPAPVAASHSPSPPTEHNGSASTTAAASAASASAASASASAEHQPTVMPQPSMTLESFRTVT